MIGAHTRAMTAVATRDQATAPPAPPVLFIRSRAAVATWLSGLTSTKAWSQPGMVAGWTKMLLANESGISTALAMLMTTAGSRTTRATAAHSQDSESPKATTRATAASTPERAAVGPVAHDQAEDHHDGGGEQVAAGIAEQAAEHEGAAPDGQAAEAVEGPGLHVLGETGAAVHGDDGDAHAEHAGQEDRR